MAVRVDARETFGRSGRLDEEGGLQSRQELLGRGAQRVAKLDEPIEAGNDPILWAKGDRGLGLAELQVAQRINKEGGPPADLVAQQRNACSRVVERLHHDVFQLLAQELLDGALVFFLYLGVVGEYSDGAEAVALGFAIRGNELLHSVSGVGPITQELLERAAAGEGPGERVAGALEAHLGLLLLAAQLRKARLRVLHPALETAQALHGCLPIEVGGFGALARVERFFEQL